MKESRVVVSERELWTPDENQCPGQGACLQKQRATTAVGRRVGRRTGEEYERSTREVREAGQKECRETCREACHEGLEAD